MCGIAGVWSAGQPSDLAPIASLMSSSLEHRGPDDCGVWVDTAAPIALSHRRLSIMDVSSAGHQPMASQCGRYVIVFNGEIYNHERIRTSLSDRDPAYSWRGHSDTETLLASISCWGMEKTLQQIEGMFAFALWDTREKALYLARDRMGEKPLYYGWQGDSFLFASELKD